MIQVDIEGCISVSAGRGRFVHLGMAADAIGRGVHVAHGHIVNTEGVFPLRRFTGAGGECEGKYCESE